MHQAKTIPANTVGRPEPMGVLAGYGRCVLLGCWILVLMAALPARVQGQPAVRLAAFNYPPFYYEEEGEILGIAVELIKEVFNRLGMPFDLTLFPLKRALEYAREGRIDGIMILIKNRERSVYLTYTHPVMTVRGLIWSRADRTGGPVRFQDLEELRAYKMGATLGYSYGQELDRLMATMRVERVASDYLNYRKLLAGRIEIFPGNEIVARGLFKRHPDLQGKFVHSGRAFITWVLHMGISKKSGLARHLPGINKILSEITAEGFLDRAVRAYTE